MEKSVKSNVSAYRLPIVIINSYVPDNDFKGSFDLLNQDLFPTGQIFKGIFTQLI